MFDFFRKNKKYPYAKQAISWRDIWEVVKVLRSPWLTQGPKIQEFEKELCNYTGAKYAVAIANGTLALDLAVAALELPHGFEGITSSITFVASANCILRNNGIVKFADIEPTTANIDVQEIKKQITSQTKVLIPVHFAGQSCEMRKIATLAKEHNLYVIEDAAHAIGSEYEGEKVGSCKYSDMTIFSFHPVKTVCSGEGGAITTNNKGLYEKLLMLRTIGITRDPKKLMKNDGPWYYEMQGLSTNARLSDIHAALGLSQLKRVDEFKKYKREIVQFYLSELSNDERFLLLEEKSYSNACFHLCPLLINFKVVKKDKVQIVNELKEAGLFLQVHYIPVHTQPYYQKLGFKHGDYPQAEDYYRSSISLPLYPSLKKSDLRHIVKIIKQVVR